MIGVAPLPDGGRLRFIDEGAGPPLVLISGLGGLASFWDGFAEHCAQRFRVIRYDHQGVGNSVAQPKQAPQSSIAEMMADLVALLDHLGLDRVAVLGHSTGGAIAQELALAHPHRLSRLVLSATFARPCAYMHRLFAGRLDILDQLGLNAFRRQAALILNPPNWIANNDERLERDLLRAAAAERPDDADMVRHRIEAILGHDTADQLGQIACPTLVVVAADDPVTPVYHSRALADGILGARLEILPSGGHYAVRAEPALYRDAILPFLEAGTDPAPQAKPMMRPTPRTVAIVGLGLIGQRWAVAFAHAGLSVTCFDPDRARWTAFEAVRGGLENDLDALVQKTGPSGSISFSDDLGTALEGAEFVQENGPEQLELKQGLLREIEAHVPETTIIASSSSALLVSDMQARCVYPGRIVLGHPFNPAHLMPLVEIVGGNHTRPEALEAAFAFYEAIGKKPIVLRREITGHLALRLMGAMWREAIALVRDHVASPADVDRAFCYGPGPKWTLQGSFISNALNAEGIGSFLEKYGPTYQAIWDDLGDATLDEATRAAVTQAVENDLMARSQADLRASRDRGLVAILRAVERDGAL